MIAPAIFQGIVLPSVAVAANQGKRAQTFAKETPKCAKTLICWWRWRVKKTKTLMKASKHWRQNFGPSMYTVVKKLGRIFFFFPLKLNFRFDVFSSDITLCVEIFQCNLYLTSYGWTNKSVTHFFSIILLIQEHKLNKKYI